jgi:hypothetical protein
MINTFSFIKSIDSIIKLSGSENLYQWRETFKAMVQRHRLWIYFDLLMDRRFIKKSILLLSIYDLYLEVKSENAESIFKTLNERYNHIQYNENYKK